MSRILDTSALQLDVVKVPAGETRDVYLPLFRLADDSPTEIGRYYQTGTLFGLVPATEQTPIGHALVTKGGARDVAELKNVAIAEHRQGQGLGRYLLTGVLERLAATGYARVIVGTSNASLDNLAFYQKLGFRIWRIERDYFSAARGYGPGCIEDGIPVIDMVWLDLLL